MLRLTGKIEDDASVYVIGHPCGLPIKFTGASNVRDNGSDFFTANLDRFGGNARSPVFNSEKDEVEGLVAQGDVDFIPNENCNVSLIWPTTGRRGFRCTRTTKFSVMFQEYV